jgi:hypothetical protein
VSEIVFKLNGKFLLAYSAFLSKTMEVSTENSVIQVCFSPHKSSPVLENSEMMDPTREMVLLPCLHLNLNFRIYGSL